MDGCGAWARLRSSPAPCWPVRRQITTGSQVFGLVTLVGALVLGSHAMYDSFAVIRWREAGIRPATIALLWSESVAAEVLVFLLIGPPLLRLLKPTGALAWAALCGLLRWGVMAQTTELAALALVQPLHGFTFALLHLASMRLITDTVPSVMAGTAQAVYSLVGVGGATAVFMIVSGGFIPVSEQPDFG
jgi:PPP family 3-phenylpropionic acid transporter